MTGRTRSLVAGAVAAFGAAALMAASPKIGAGALAMAKDLQPNRSLYRADGRLVQPEDYRTWVFLSSGVDMSYSAESPAPAVHGFDNVFVPRSAYGAFQQTGRWPDKTVLILENRAGAARGSINQRGLYQTGAVTGLEAHVKDTSRFKGGWGFFSLSGPDAGKQIPLAANCYACHEAHAAADTTFVQFYPTLLPVALDKGTITPGYGAETPADRPETQSRRTGMR